MSNQNNLPAPQILAPRLPMPRGLEISPDAWRVLTDSLFPSAETAEAVVLAIQYCKVRGLDVFKKPVHIVPMWNSKLKKNVETVWPGINEIQTTAARTKEWAGMDEPKWGPLVTKTFKGKEKKYRENSNQYDLIDAEISLEFPEFCSVTVYRMVEGQRCAFTEQVFWMEAYNRASSNSEIPNSMWQKRVRGQLHKVTKAAVLRAAFPEHAEYTADEMIGQDIAELAAQGIVIDHNVAEPAAPAAPAHAAPAPAQAPAAPPPAPAAAPAQAAPASGPINPPPVQRPVNPETKDFTPHMIAVQEVGGAPNWRDWSMLMAAALRNAADIQELELWVSFNQVPLKELATAAPNSSARIDELIADGRRALQTIPQQA